MHLDKILTKEFLLKKLIGEKMPIMVLANELKCCKGSIINYCKKINIHKDIRQANDIKPEKHNLAGKRFGKLIAVSQASRDGLGKARWLCSCDCGRQKMIATASLLRNLSRSCGYCIRNHYKGYKNINGSFFRKIKQSADTRGYKFNITTKYIWDLYEKQNRKCALSGLPIEFVTNPSREGKYQTASIDRIDSSKGYIRGNVQIVHKRINMLKGSLSNEELIFICEKIYLNNKYNINSSTITSIDIDNIRCKQFS